MHGEHVWCMGSRPFISVAWGRANRYQISSVPKEMDSSVANSVEREVDSRVVLCGHIKLICMLKLLCR